MPRLPETQSDLTYLWRPLTCGEAQSQHVQNGHDVVLRHMAVVPRPPVHCAWSSSRPFVTSHPSVVRHRRLVVRYVVVPPVHHVIHHAFVLLVGKGKRTVKQNKTIDKSK